MNVTLIYRAGRVPPEAQPENVAALWDWLAWLEQRPEHVLTTALGPGVRVSNQGVEREDEPEVFGFSVVDVPDMADAIALTAPWPELQWGGRVEVRPEIHR